MALKDAWKHCTINGILESITLTLIIAYILFYGSVFEASYPKEIVELYSHPWWRILVIILVALGISWCPRIGLAMALAVFLYLNDMDILTSPFLSSQ
jgi:succinate dehydrogenase hydrophobic anchor subunit